MGYWLMMEASKATAEANMLRSGEKALQREEQLQMLRNKDRKKAKLNVLQE